MNIYSSTTKIKGPAGINFPISQPCRSTPLDNPHTRGTRHLGLEADMPAEKASSGSTRPHWATFRTRHFYLLPLFYRRQPFIRTPPAERPRYLLLCTKYCMYCTWDGDLYESGSVTETYSLLKEGDDQGGGCTEPLWRNPVESLRM